MREKKRMSWCTLGWVRLAGISDRKDGPASKDGPRRRAFQAEGAECAKAWGRAEFGAPRDLRGRQSCLRGRKEAGCAGLWGPFHI